MGVSTHKGRSGCPFRAHLVSPKSRSCLCWQPADDLRGEPPLLGLCVPWHDETRLNPQLQHISPLELFPPKGSFTSDYVVDANRNSLDDLHSAGEDVG